LRGLLLLFIVSAFPLACSQPEPTLDIPATVAAQVKAELAAIPTETPAPTPTPYPTYTPYPTATPRPTHTPYPTPQPTPTATATPSPTPTPTPTSEPTATPVPSPTPTTGYDRSLLIFGANNTRITHQSGDGFLEHISAGEAPGDILIEAVFLNPYSDPYLTWEHGFLFRRGERNHFYSTTIRSSLNWEKYARLGEDEFIGSTQEFMPAIDITPGGENLLQVALVRDGAYVYVNGVLAGSFPVDLDTGGDEARFIVDDTSEGETPLKYARVWRWHDSMQKDFPEVDPVHAALPTRTPHTSVPIFGPVRGSIRHDSEDGKYELSEGTDIDGDVMIEFTFEVPFRPEESHYTFGLWLDTSKHGAFHFIEVNSFFGGTFHHWRSTGPNAELQGSRGEDAPGLNLEKGEKNRVRAVLLDEEVWLYINDRKMGIFNLAQDGIPPPNWVGLVVDDYEGHGFHYGLGGSTHFEDFTVWNWHESLFDLPAGK